MNKKMLSLLLFVSLTFFCNVTLNAQVEHCGIVEYHDSAKHLHLIEKTIKPQKKQKGDWFYQIYNTITCKYENISMKPQSEVFVVTPNIIEKSFDEFLYQQGRIVCKVGNKEYTRIISLDVRPLIKDVRITNVRDVNKDFYQFDIDIKGMGANNGTVVVSDDTGVTNCYDYSDGTIHVSPMVKGSKVYIDVSLENDYGE